MMMIMLKTKKETLNQSLTGAAFHSDPHASLFSNKVTHQSSQIYQIYLWVVTYELVSGHLLKFTLLMMSHLLYSCSGMRKDSFIVF